MQLAEPVFIETACTFEHEGQTFESGGAVVTPDYLVAYPGEAGRLNDWHGRQLGTWRPVASWRVHSYVGGMMYQIEATVGGVTYTGRGFGVGMLFNGKRKAEGRR